MSLPYFFFFFFNDTATTEIYTLSLHDALPISPPRAPVADSARSTWVATTTGGSSMPVARAARSEEHTSELQSPCNLVCRLLLEKKKKTTIRIYTATCTYTAVAASLSRSAYVQA